VEPELPTIQQTESEPEGPRQFEWASKEQQEAVEHTPGPPLLMMGGFNSGKTSASILHMLALCDNFPGYKVAVLRKTFKDLSMTTRPSFDQWIDPKRVKVSNATEVVLDNGSSFIFHHLDSPNSATVLRGLEINGAILDQAEQMQERTFTILLGRLGRWKGARVPKWVINAYDGEWPWKNKSGQPVPPISCVLTANPTEDGDPELHWLWQRFSPESKSWQEKWSKQGYRQLLMPTTGNRFASEQNVELLLQQDEDYVKRYVKGEWVRSKGHLFRLDEASILDYSPELVSFIENTCLLGRVLDHGDSSPTCCLWYGVDQFHNCFFWQEYYQPGMTEDGKEFNVADHRRSITQLSRPLTFRINLADASIFDKTRNISGYTRRQHRWSVADEYMDRKIINEDTTIAWTPSDRNEALSRQRLSQYLRLDPKHRHPITGDLGAPHIYFVARSDEHPHGIDHAIREIRNAKRLAVGENDGKPIYSDERDPSIPDHALDCVRYVVNSHPIPASSPREDMRTTATAQGDGRVMVTLPPVQKDGKPFVPKKDRFVKSRWQSRGGGY
jgi:hypothetical protein